MKIILSSKKHHYLAIVSTFLITIALIAGIVGGEPTLAQQYDLTIDSTAGGSVTMPGEGVFSCDLCAAVNLVATPSSGYQFVNWTGDVDTIANVNAASTTITLNGDYSITANFEAIPAGQYRLAIASSGCGFVSTPGEGIFDYDEGTVVELVANVVGDNLFVKWTGDVSTIADVEDATTTITMHGDYAITATFLCVTSCFIATAAYGTPMAKEVEILREFRDKYLMTNPVGKGLVDFYYKVSPPVAEFITKHPSLKPIVRVGLLPVVAMSTLAVNTTSVGKMGIVGLLVLVSAVLVVWAKRRRGKGPEYSAY
ncbi:MAG: CFI-box-CTERM domain-containing protein [Chloroflexota bacterium]